MERDNWGGFRGGVTAYLRGDAMGNQDAPGAVMGRRG
jgi:hypothetical protein